MLFAYGFAHMLEALGAWLVVQALQLDPLQVC